MKILHFNRFIYTKSYIIFILFVLFTPLALSQTCISPNIGNTSTGEPFNIPIGQAKNDVYFNATVPTFRDMLGINVAIYQLENNKLATYSGVNIQGQTKTVLDVFSNFRVFYPCHRDYWDFGDEPLVPYPNAEQVPKNNMSKLRLITSSAGIPLAATGQTGNVIYPVPSTTVAGKIELRTEPLKAAGSYFNVYQNYMNNSWIKMQASFDYLRLSTQPINKKFTVTLEVIPTNFINYHPYEFPNNWFLEQDWGSNDAERKLNAKAYATMFARTYAPKNSDCATCPKMVDIVEIGNEPWGYANATTYHSIVRGFIEGINEYYGSDTLNKIRLLPGSFQAQHEENSNPTSVTDISSWKDNINTRLPAESKCELEGVNLHLYSNTIAGNSLTLNTSYPEKVSQSGTQTTAVSRFYFVKNAWKWLKDNTFAKKNIFITEFGWDSEGCAPEQSVGPKTQAIYTIRNLLMMGRYGVKRANLYQIEDDPNVGCGFAYFASGVWTKTKTPKYIFRALENFIQKAGSTKFHYALREDPNDVHAYILENQDQPKYMVAWLARNINYSDINLSLNQIIALGGADLSDGVGALKSISLNFNGKTFTPDASQSWFQLDGESLQPLNKATYFVNGQYKLSPIPILIPIVESCSPDVHAPDFTNCPTNITQATASTTAIVTWTLPTVTDNCAATPSVSSTHNSGSAFPIGTTPVTYSATDASNNTATCTFTVTVSNPCANDAQAPVFTNCPTNITQTTTGTTAAVTWTPPTATDNCSTPSVISSHTVGATFPIGTTTVTYTATDAKNNVTTCVFTITVTNPCANDTLAPVFTNCPSNINQVTTGTTATATWTPPSVTDNCTSSPTVTSTHNTGAVFPIGTTSVTYTAIDAKNNTSRCVFTVTVTNPCANDTLAPIFNNCNGNIAQTTAGTTANITWIPPTVSDNCTISPTLTSTHAPNSAFPIGVTTVTYTARDSSNNSSICRFTVTVTNPCASDTQAPVLSACPANINQTTTGTTATVTWIAPTATDNCTTSPTIISTHNSGAAFPIGVTTVTFTARDASNNVTTCTFTVTISAQPTNYCVSKATEPWQDWVTGVQLGTINNMVQTNEGKFRTSNSVGYSDFTDMQTTIVRGQTYPLSIKPGFSWAGRLPDLNCRAWIDFNGNKIFEDTEKVFEGKAQNTFTASVFIPATVIVGLSRMRVSVKSGGMPTSCESFLQGEVEDYAVSIETDGTDCVNDKQSPSFNNCPTDISQTATGAATIVTWTPPTAIDNCSTVTLTSTHSPNTAFPIGETIVTYTATDARNNSRTCSFTVTVTGSNPCDNDIVKPVFTNCPTNISLTTDGTAAIATWTPPTASDNCTPPPSVSSSHNSGASFPIGTTTVTYTATDAKNNVNTCIFTVTVSTQSANYCVSKAAEPWQEWVSGVKLGTINNTPQTNDGKFRNAASVGYSDFTDLQTAVNRGQSYPLSILPGISWSGRLPDLYCRVWIDFNKNKTFEDTEKVFEGRAQNPFNSNLTIPASALSGTTRMRVSIKSGSVPLACESFTQGEVEDYIVNIAGGVDCTNDAEVPIFANCPTNISQTTTGTTANVTWTPPTATDNCTTTPTITSSRNPNTVFPMGVTTVTYTATDAKNNVATCTFTVTVTNPCANDVQAPVFVNCPTNIAQTASSTTAIVTWTPPTATDNCTTSPTITSTHNPNTAFPLGVTTVTYTARDARNNASTCSFTITISAPSANYCVSKSTEPWQEWVNGVQVAGINTNPQANDGKFRSSNSFGYSDFTDLPSTVIRGQTYPLSIKPGFSWSGRLTDLYCRVWIDFNGNKTFEDAEKVFEGRAQNPFSSTLLVPATATSGNARMRVSVKSGAYALPCENFTQGEVEDYLLIIQ